MVDKVSIGKIIQTLRKDRKLTQEELAEKIDISKNYLSKVERGISKLNIETFLKMADVLSFTLEDFGVNKQNKNGKYKIELLELILTFSESEANAYLEILHTIRSALKNC